MSGSLCNISINKCVCAQIMLKEHRKIQGTAESHRPWTVPKYMLNGNFSIVFKLILTVLVSQPNMKEILFSDSRLLHILMLLQMNNNRVVV